MIIVAGHLVVDPARRDTILDARRAVVVAARSAPGCHDFSMTADLVESDRINIFERWDSASSVEAFRGQGPDDDQQDDIRGADVAQYEVSEATSLT